LEHQKFRDHSSLSADHGSIHHVKPGANNSPLGLPRFDQAKRIKDKNIHPKGFKKTGKCKLYVFIPSKLPHIALQGYADLQRERGNFSSFFLPGVPHSARVENSLLLQLAVATTKFLVGRRHACAACGSAAAAAALVD
jgi:hypothetical protein